jgi:hypothetical protein
VCSSDLLIAFPATALETISKLHHLFVYLKEILQENEHYEKTRQIADKFEKKAKIMENNLYFIRQGELSKMSRGKRATMYWFFLFSDQLIYAHLNRGQYVIHEELSLMELQVSDCPGDLTMCSFQVEHPVKSFQVTAESPSVKQAWLRDINLAIASCKKRRQLKSASFHDPRRMSMIGRIESQKAAQQQEQDAAKRAQDRAYIYKAEGEMSPVSSLSGSTTKRTSFSSQAVPFSAHTPAAVEDNGNSTRSPFQELRQSAKDSLLAEDEESPSAAGAAPVAPTSADGSAKRSGAAQVSGHKLSGIFSAIEAEAEEQQSREKKGLLS